MLNLLEVILIVTVAAILWLVGVAVWIAYLPFYLVAVGAWRVFKHVGASSGQSEDASPDFR
jgi:hypothetical protein